MLESKKNALLNDFRKKSSWGVNEVISKIEKHHNTIEASLVTLVTNQSQNQENISKKFKTVESIKKYDICYVERMGSVHYSVVAKVDNKKGIAYVIPITSKEKHSTTKILKDRYFCNSYFSDTITIENLGNLKNRFVRVYENKKEAFDAINLVINIYKRLSLNKKRV